MKLLRHFVASFVIFAVLISLVLIQYDGIEEGYDIVKGDVLYLNETGETGNIADQLKGLNLIEGVAGINAGIAQLNPGSASATDVLGGLASVAVGTLKTTLGLLTMPYGITNIILTYYAGEIPGVIGGLVVLVAVYAAFILLSAYLRSDV